MASLFTPFVNDMQPKGLVQGQFGGNSMMMGQQGQKGGLTSIVELIRKLRQGNQPQDELTRNLEELRKSMMVSGKF